MLAHRDREFQKLLTNSNKCAADPQPIALKPARATISASPTIQDVRPWHKIVRDGTELAKRGIRLDNYLMDREFWSRRRVLVTGHTGFKGSWLCLLLNKLGAEVVGYALDPPTEPSLFRLARVDEDILSVHGDIRDLGHLSTVIRDHAPEVIFHLAAQSVVRHSYADPLETYSTNVLGTAAVFEAVRALPDPRILVNVTTDKCYKNREWIWGYRESDELGGHDPYSNSKACAELLTQSYRDSFFAPAEFAHHKTRIATARAGNVIGGGDWTADQLIPDIVRAFSAGKPVLIRQPDSVRPWQHVLDCLSGYVLLAEKLGRNETELPAWNFGPPFTDTKTVSSIAGFLAKAWGNGAEWQLDKSTHAHESRMLRLDSSRANEVLGWKPKLRLTEALTWTVEWYKNHYAGSPARELCLDQIDGYLRLAEREER